MLMWQILLQYLKTWKMTNDKQEAVAACKVCHARAHSKDSSFHTSFCTCRHTAVGSLSADSVGLRREPRGVEVCELSPPCPPEPGLGRYLKAPEGVCSQHPDLVPPKGCCILYCVLHCNRVFARDHILVREVLLR